MEESKRLPTDASIFTAEAVALEMALTALQSSLPFIDPLQPLLLVQKSDPLPMTASFTASSTLL